MANEASMSSKIRRRLTRTTSIQRCKILGIFAVACTLVALLLTNTVSCCSAFSPSRRFHFETRNRVNTALLASRSSRSRRSSTTATTKDVSSQTLPSRNAKHRKRREQQQQQPQVGSASKGSTNPTLQQVAHHVAEQYLYGSGGVLRQGQIKSNRRMAMFPNNNHNDDNSSSSSSTHNSVHGEQQQLEDQASYLRMLDKHPCLLLNADYQPMSNLPLSLWHWQEAVKAVFLGKVTVVDVYDDIKIRAANLEVPLPSVIALNEYVPQFNQRPAFTKRNVFLRDEYRCQYCSDRFYKRDLSLDHVVPRCQGGLLTWENAVTCCNKCNCKKGSLHVDQLKSVGMKLTREPFVPTQYQLAAIASKMLPQQVHPTWEPYLGRARTAGSEGEQTKKKKKTSGE